MPEIILLEKDRNLCVNLLRKPNKVFYNNLNVKRNTGILKFWQTVKPNFTGTALKDVRITFVDGDKVIAEEKDVFKKVFLKSKTRETLLIALHLN